MHRHVAMPAKKDSPQWKPREDKGDRELRYHPYTPYSIGNSSRVIFRIGIKVPRAWMFRGGFAWLNAVQNMSGERQRKRKEIERIPEYWSEMSRRSPGKRESLDSLTTHEISLARRCRNLSALIKWEISPVYWKRSFVQFREFKIQRRGRQLERQKNNRFN